MKVRKVAALLVSAIVMVLPALLIGLVFGVDAKVVTEGPQSIAALVALASGAICGFLGVFLASLILRKRRSPLTEMLEAVLELGKTARKFGGPNKHADAA
jgi:amino acid transporter